MALRTAGRCADGGETPTNKPGEEIVDSPHRVGQHSGEMPQLESSGENQRRSSRRFARLAVPVAGTNVQGEKFREVCKTIVVSAHGALLYVGETLELGAIVNVTSPATEEVMDCRVVYLGDYSDLGRRVGIEFLTTAPHFWGIEFPSDSPPSSSPTVH